MSLKQEGLYKGIYEFEDPSGGLLAAKVPFSGSAALYRNTVVIVRPNQKALVIYKGQAGELLSAGSHEIKTENFPILTSLANWKFGFKSPLRCEIWFFSGNMHTSKKWGTRSPVMSTFNNIGTIPIRAFGTFQVRSKNPKKMYEALLGSRNFLDIDTVEEFVQGQVTECLPEALKICDEIAELNRMQDKISKTLEKLVQSSLNEYGLKISHIQIQSLLPPEEVMDALESRVAMNLLGDQKKYLLYKTANSLDQLADGEGGDSMQMMMGLMLGKEMLGMSGASEPTKSLGMAKTAKGKKHCHSCGAKLDEAHRFCFQCGVKQ